MHQYATLEDTVFMGFGSNNTAGSAADGTTPLYYVRLGGAAASAAPVFSGTPTLLTHADYPPGSYEIAPPMTAANGCAAGNTYLVFSTLTVDGQTPGACIGSITLAPVVANATQILGTAVSTPATAGVLDVNVKNVIGTAVTGAGTAADPWGP